jgi:Lar family restriction alleviation protein
MTRQEAIGRLRECPFCGEVELNEPPANDRGEYTPETQVVCYGCGATGPSRDAAGQRADAIERWNTRTLLTVEDGDVERVAKRLAGLYDKQERADGRPGGALVAYNAGVDMTITFWNDMARAAIEAYNQ